MLAHHDRVAKTRYPVATRGSNASSTTDYEGLSYDAASNVTQRRLRDAQVIGYAYDALGRLVTKDLPSTEPDASYAYDLLGRMTGATQNGMTNAFAFDALGRNTSATAPQGVVSNLYDVAGRRTRTTYPGSGLYITYDYDVTGNVTAIRENGAASGVGVLASYAFDSLGRRSSVTYGNGTTQTFAYNAAQRLSALTNNLAGTTQDLAQAFAYNPAAQIDTATRTGDAYAWTGHYNVDRSYTANGLNQLTNAGGTTLSYDARGNLAQSGSDTFGYSSENFMKTGPGGASLAYDPLGRLYATASTASTETRFAYDGLALIGEYDSGNALLRRYVHGPGTDEPIVWYEGSGTADRRFLMADERGSVVSVTDSAGAVLALNTYDEYGIPANTVTGSQKIYGRFGYTSQTWIREIGMYYYKARMYSPTLGRFMQTDPIGYADGMNWYNYVRSDPVNLTDSSGLCGRICDLEEERKRKAAKKIKEILEEYKKIGKQVIDPEFSESEFASSDEAAIAWAKLWAPFIEYLGNNRELLSIITKSKQSFSFTVPYIEYLMKDRFGQLKGFRDSVYLDPLSNSGIFAPIHSHPLSGGISDTDLDVLRSFPSYIYISGLGQVRFFKKGGLFQEGAFGRNACSNSDPSCVNNQREWK